MHLVLLVSAEKKNKKSLQLSLNGKEELLMCSLMVQEQISCLISKNVYVFYYYFIMIQEVKESFCLLSVCMTHASSLLLQSESSSSGVL